MKFSTMGVAFAWLCVGVFTSAVAIGYLVGASNSPVVASVVPAAFALLGLAFGVFTIKSPQATEDKGFPQLKENLPAWQNAKPIGILLTLFAVTYLGSALIGSRIRVIGMEPTKSPFPWGDKNRPTSTKVALSWLVIQKRLMAYGYTEDQVQQIYALSQQIEAAQVGHSLDLSPNLLDDVPEPGKPMLKERASGSMAGAKIETSSKVE